MEFLFVIVNDVEDKVIDVSFSDLSEVSVVILLVSGENEDVSFEIFS